MMILIILTIKYYSSTSHAIMYHMNEYISESLLTITVSVTVTVITVILCCSTLLVNIDISSLKLPPLTTSRHPSDTAATTPSY